MSSAPTSPLQPVASDSSATEGMPRRYGKYTLLRKLATGGMAELFLALHRSVAGFEKIIVIKRILPSMNTDQAFIGMLLQEARIAATLSHPNVVQIFDVGHAEGSYYIAMEHIHGEDLRSIVRQMKKVGLSEFPMEHALAIVSGLCAGLAYAHEKRGLDGQPLRIVHRDVSPQNVVVTYAGDIKIVDFGIAKSGANEGEDTRSGRLKGKVPYMSPEQARGEEIDWRSDIFAAGIVLFELTTGKRLFKGRNELDTLRLVCEREYPFPSQVRPGYPRRLEVVVMRALAKDREQRYQSAREMQADIENYARDERVAVSTIELREWMQSLFADKLAQQKEVLQDLKQLADVIAQQSLTDTGTYDGLENSTSSAGLSTYPSAPGASRTLAAESTSRGLKAIVAVVVVLGMVAVAVAAFLFVRSGRSEVVAVAGATSTPVGGPSGGVGAEHGSIELISTPPGAAIWINGELRGERTPATIDKLPRNAAIDVKLTMEGFAAARKEVTLTDDQPKQTVRHELTKGTVTLVVETNAAGAKVFIDKKSYEELRVEGLSAGEEHKVVVAASGYLPRTARFTAGPNETKTLSLMLEKEGEAGKGKTPPGKEANPVAAEPAAAPGKLNVGSRGGYCNVSVRGQGYGPTPVGGIVLPAGSHTVVCKPESGAAQSMGVTIQPGKTARVSFQL